MVIITMLTGTLIQGFSQEISAEDRMKDTASLSTDSAENTRIAIGKDFVVVEDNEDEIKVKFGNRELSILESLEEGESRINLQKTEDVEDSLQEEDEDQWTDRTRRGNRFRGHWAGAEIGFNNYNYNRNTILPADIAYMKLNSGKSMSFNINFSQVSLGITRHFGVVTGLGLNWNNYVFTGNNNIQIGDNGFLTEQLSPDGLPLKKSKFTTIYLNVPAILELQLPTGEGHRLNIGAGVIGGIKLGSHTKMIIEENGQKIKSNTDLNLNMLRGGVTARIGYENFMIYGSYYLTPWFMEQLGPDGYQLEPFEIGFAFTFND